MNAINLHLRTSRTKTEKHRHRAERTGRHDRDRFTSWATATTLAYHRDVAQGAHTVAGTSDRAIGNRLATSTHGQASVIV